MKTTQLSFSTHHPHIEIIENGSGPKITKLSVNE